MNNTCTIHTVNSVVNELHHKALEMAWTNYITLQVQHSTALKEGSTVQVQVLVLELRI